MCGSYGGQAGITALVPQWGKLKPPTHLPPISPCGKEISLALTDDVHEEDGDVPVRASEVADLLGDRLSGSSKGEELDDVAGEDLRCGGSSGGDPGHYKLCESV